MVTNSCEARPEDVQKALSPTKHSTVPLRCFGSMGMKELT